MNKNTKRFISFILASAITLSNVAPSYMTAFAESATEAEAYGEAESYESYDENSGYEDYKTGQHVSVEDTAKPEQQQAQTPVAEAQVNNSEAAPVEQVQAEPEAPVLQSATFDLNKSSVFIYFRPNHRTDDSAKETDHFYEALFG